LTLLMDHHSWEVGSPLCHALFDNLGLLRLSNKTFLSRTFRRIGVGFARDTVMVPVQTA
jgi:hypothetical protein